MNNKKYNRIKKQKKKTNRKSFSNERYKKDSEFSLNEGHIG